MFPHDVPLDTMTIIDLASGRGVRAMERRAPNGVTTTPKNTAQKPVRQPKKRYKNPKKTQTVRGYKYDWYAVRTAFVEGIKEEGSEEATFYNLVDIAERFKIPLNRVREMSADERWFEQRSEYQIRHAKARQAKRILELSGESVDFDSKSLNLAKLGMAMVTARMSEIARDVKEQSTRREAALRQQMDGYPVDAEDLQTVIDARELSTLAAAATGWQSLGQKALGTDIQRMDIQQDIKHNIDVDVQVTSISAELGRDDPERLAGFLQAAKRAGLLDTIEDGPEELPALEQAEPEEDIEEAELVDDEPTEGESLQF